MKTLLINVVLLLILCGQSYGQLPPAPPGFQSPVSVKIQSPKATTSGSGALMVKPPSGLTMMSIEIPTNHMPPAVSIEWHRVIGGPYGVADANLGNAVQFKLINGGTYLNFEHMGVGGKTYELQVNFGFPDTNWWSYSRVVMPKDDKITIGHPIYSDEKQRFFRIRSN